MCFVFRCKVCILWYWCNCSRKYHSYHSAGYYKKSRWDRTFFSIIILATVVYAVYEASILLTKFSEENLEMQAAASEKMLATAENLVKHFDSAKEKLETLEEVINNNNESISNIAQSTGSTAEAIQQQALMCEEIHKNTDSAEKETEAMIDKANHTMENVAEGARLVTGLKNQADNVEQASNQAQSPPNRSATVWRK